MSGEIRLKATGDNKELVKALDQTRKQVVSLEKQLERASAKSKKMTAEERALGREAKKVMEDVQAPAERYRAKLERLNELFRKGKIDGETWGRATVKAKADMLVAQRRLEEQTKSTSETTKKAAQKQQQLARAGKAVFDQTRTPLQRYNAELGRLQYLLRRGAIGQNTYRAAVRQTTAEFKHAESAGMQAFGRTALSAVTSLTTALGVGGGLYGAISLVKGELDAMVAKWEKAKQSTQETADPQIAALRNLGAKSFAERDEFTDRIAAMSEDLGIDQKDLYARASDALSARGDLPVEDALRAVRASARIAPESADVGKPLAGVALDIAKIQKGMTPEQAIGYVLGVGQMARPTSTGNLASNVGPALSGAMANGASLQDAGSLWAAITQGTTDDTGRLAGTAAIALSTQLREFLPDVKSMDERIQMLQQDEALRTKFLDTASFEKKAQTSVEQIISGQGTAAEAYSQFKTRMPNQEEAGRIFETQVEIISGDMIQTTAAIARDFKTTAKNLELADQDAARSAVAVEDFTRTLEQIGLPHFAARLKRFGATVSGDALESVLSEIEQQREKLLHPMQEHVYHPLGSPTAYSTKTPRESTAKELDQAAELGGLLTRVRGRLEKEAEQQSGLSNVMPVVPTNVKSSTQVVPSIAESIPESPPESMNPADVIADGPSPTVASPEPEIVPYDLNGRMLYFRPTVDAPETKPGVDPGFRDEWERVKNVDGQWEPAKDHLGREDGEQTRAIGEQTQGLREDNRRVIDLLQRIADGQRQPAPRRRQARLPASTSLANQAHSE